MPILINDNSARVQYTATSSQTVFTVPFEFFANADLKVYQNATLKTITTHYTVTGAGVTGGGTVTFVTGATLNDVITIVRDVAVARVTDFPTSGPFVIEDLNTDLDRLTAMIQQQETKLARTIRLDDFDTPNTFAVLPVKASRVGKILAFDTNGDPVVGEDIGNWRGNWAASVVFTVRDLVKTSDDSNVYRVNTAHTSSGTLPLSTNVDYAKFDLVVDAAASAASAAAAAASASAASTSASNASTSASNASASASTATTQASNASTSASAAAASAAAAAASFDAFDDIYLGAYATDPTLDNDGNALTIGDLYFNTGVNRLKVYSGATWLLAIVDTTTVVEKTGTTGAALIPASTTANRPTPATGQFRFNTDLTEFEGYNGTAWGSIGGGATGGGSDEIFFENGQTVTTNYTISTNYNAGTFGPITVNSSVTVTVPSGSTWSIV